MLEMSRALDWKMQAIRAAILLMIALVHEWLDTLQEDEPAGREESQSTLAVARLEGIGLCFLCSPDVSIRRAAWDFLAAVRLLSLAVGTSSAAGKWSTV